MSATAQTLRPPSKTLMFLEGRAIHEFGAFLGALPLLSLAPSGDGHPVLVLPGLVASDVSTRPLRAFLNNRGYAATGWRQGRNFGLRDGVREAMVDLVQELNDIHGRKVSLVGWSLGGIYAREIARQHPGHVRQVITLGSPFALTDSRQSYADRSYRRRAALHANGRVPTAQDLSLPIPVPSTAVYSRRDGIVAWQACIEAETDLHQNVEVRCAHLGFGIDPATLWLIADRLAVPAGQRREFRPPAALRALYPARDQARSDQNAAAHRT